MTKIVFARHGETIGNVDPDFGCNETGFLTLKGMKQAELGAISLLREKLDIKHFYTSKMIRAIQTCTIFMQVLGEFNFRGIHREELLNEWHQPKGPFEQKVDEVKMILPEILSSDGNVLVVSHYFTMQAIFDVLELDKPREQYWSHLKTVSHARPFIYDTEEKTLDIFNEHRKDNGVAHG